jgi:hypothetical protein
MYDMTRFLLSGEMYNYGDQPYHDTQESWPLERRFLCRF